MKRQSRLETNKDTRRVLNRHGVDLSYCSYTCYGSEVKLSGWLAKTDGSNFNGPQIESILIDFQRHLPGFTVLGDFENWHFTTEHITFLGEREKTNHQQDDIQSLFEDDYDSDVG